MRLLSGIFFLLNLCQWLDVCGKWKHENLWQQPLPLTFTNSNTAVYCFVNLLITGCIDRIHHEWKKLPSPPISIWRIWATIRNNWLCFYGRLGGQLLCSSCQLQNESERTWHWKLRGEIETSKKERERERERGSSPMDLLFIINTKDYHCEPIMYRNFLPVPALISALGKFFFFFLSREKSLIRFLHGLLCPRTSIACESCYFLQYFASLALWNCGGWYLLDIMNNRVQ